MRTAKKAQQKVGKKKPKSAVAFPRKPLKTIEALTRRTITIRSATEEAINTIVGPRKFSSYVQSALDDRLQGQRIDEWLAEQQTEHGPLSPQAIEFAENAWQSRK